MACPRCGWRQRVIATVEDPVAVRQILAPGVRPRRFGLARNADVPLDRLDDTPLGTVENDP